MNFSNGKPVHCHLYPEDLWELAPTHDGDRLTCEFILIETDQILHFVAGPITQYKYHAVLANHFCELHSLPYAWTVKPDQGEIYDRRYKIIGGGVLTVDRSAGMVRVFGTSRAYGHFRPDHVRRAMDVCPHLNAMALIIDA